VIVMERMKDEGKESQVNVRKYRFRPSPVVEYSTLAISKLSNIVINSSKFNGE
jgi:hypothetical protein